MCARSNRPCREDIRTMPIGETATLPADQLALLQEEAVAALNAAKTLKDWLKGAVALRYADRAQALRCDQGKDTGMVRFEDGGVTVVADLPKKVDWNQGQLAALVECIRASGGHPAEYVEITFKVPERKYAAWPSHIRDVFAAARMVRVGKPAFLLSLREEAPGKR
jgi:hypothetical protein